MKYGKEPVFQEGSGCCVRKEKYRHVCGDHRNGLLDSFLTDNQFGIDGASAYWAHIAWIDWHTHSPSQTHKTSHVRHWWQRLMSHTYWLDLLGCRRQMRSRVTINSDISLILPESVTN